MTQVASGDANLMSDAALALIGAVTGVLAGLLGVGGGFVMVPLLSAGGFLMREAAALSLMFVTVSSVSGSWRHFRQRTMDPVVAGMVIATAAPAAPLGAYLGTNLPDLVLRIVFSVLAAGICLHYWLRGSARTEAAASQAWSRFYLQRRRVVGGRETTFNVDIPTTLVLGAAVGLSSGLLGVGGGWLMVPLFVMVLGIPIHIAIGTSLLAILGPALGGTYAHWLAGNLDLAAAPWLVVPAVLTAQIGAKLVVRFSDSTLRRLLLILLVSATAYMAAGVFIEVLF